MPKGAAANLAIGGARPGGDRQREARPRWRAAGRRCPSARRAAPRQRAFSASGVGKAMDWSRLVVLVESSARSRAAAGRLQPHLGLQRQPARHRRREAHRQRPDRQAGRGCTLALAGKLGGTSRTWKPKTLLDAVRHPWLAPRRCPAPHQADARAGRKGTGSAPAVPHPPPPFEMRRLGNTVARGAAHDHQRQTLADAPVRTRPWPARCQRPPRPTGAAGSAAHSSMAALFQGWWRSRPAAGGEGELRLPRALSGFQSPGRAISQRVPGGNGAVKS